MADWKYCNSEKAGISEVKTFLASQNTPPAVSYVVEHVLAHIGFKEALDKKSVQQVPDIPAATAAGPAGMDERAAHVMRGDHAQVTQRCSSDNSNSTPGPAAQDPSPCGFIAGQPASTEDFVLRIVQDADRLDALGAIGIARCLTFGGRFNRTLYDPAIAPRVGLTKAQYTATTAATEATTLNHFHEKLFLLPGLMNTRAGLHLAEARTRKMRAFLHDFEREWAADDLPSAVTSATKQPDPL